MKFRINWTELMGYYIELEANSKKEALELFEECEHDCPPCPDGFCEVESDSIEAIELCTECREAIGDRHLGSCGKRVFEAETVILEDCED